MKRFLLSMIMLLAISSGVTAKTKYVSANLNLRLEPSMNSPVLAVIPKGTTIEIEDDCQCMWVPVYYKGRVGYVCTKYITDLPTKSIARHSNKKGYYTNSYGNRVQSPTYYSSKPAGATALCRDGSYSFSRSRRGTCSHHGGVVEWY